MSKSITKGIYEVSQNKRKQICLKVSLPYGAKYLKNLDLIYKSASEKIDEIPEDNSNYQAVSEKLYCYSCNTNFKDYREMRKHQWTRSHQVKSGLITTTNDSFLDDDNGDSDEINTPYDECLFDEEVEVDNENEDQDSDDNDDLSDIISFNDEKATDNFTNYDYISALKNGKISFNEVCSFSTVYFQNSNNEIVGIKRCILFNKKNKPENSTELLNCVSKLIECKKIAVFLYSGGCFAGAIFEGNRQILHKTIKRYTYRRQQGGSQTTKDNQGQACKSGGAYLRRVNTRKLLDDVFQLLHQTWASDIDKCDLILVWSAKSQRHIFGHEGMFNQNRQKLSFDIGKDCRVRFISARVSKVNSTTLLDVYQQTSTIEVYNEETVASFMPKEMVMRENVEKESEAGVGKSINKMSKKRNKKTTQVSDDNSGPEIVDKCANQTDIDAIHSEGEAGEVIIDVRSTREDDDIRTKLLNYVLNDSAEDLIPYINELRLSKSCDEISNLLSTPLKTRNQSFLHLAINHNNVNVIPLLLESGCDPVHRNIDEETPYAQAIQQRNKAACAIMSEYMFKNPNQYNYHAAKFPGGKDPAREEQKQKLLAVKKKQYRKDRKNRMKLEEEQRKKEVALKCERDQFLALDNASKINHLKQMERDQRKRFLLCFQCATDISDIVPFSYSDFSFCGMDCLKKHRFSNEK